MALEDILKSEFSDEFISLMNNRMIMSYYKYGPVSKSYPELADAMASLEMRLQKYKETGNTEFLVDVANFAMIEFMKPKHPNAHFRATDSDESPGLVGVSYREFEESLENL